MQILLIQDDLEIREKLSFAIEGTFPWATVARAANLADAESALSRQELDWKLIIIDLPGATSEELESFLSGHQNVGALLFELPPGGPARESSPAWNLFGTLERKDLIKTVSAQIRKLIELNKLPSPTRARGEFTRIRTQILLSVAPLKGDIFIRLGEAHFVKLFHQGDSFKDEDLEKYTGKKGVEYLYVRTSQTQEFIEKYHHELLKMLSSSDQMSLEEIAKTNESVYETIQGLGHTLGFNKDVQSMAKTSMRVTVNAMGKSPQLSQVLSRLESFGGKYISSHSTLTGFIACAIASHLEWGSEATFHKLTLAAMLHDITMESHELAQVETLEELEQGNFNDAQKKEFRSHMVAGAEVARGFTEVPADVDAIIAQHHEKPDGKGFPRGLTHTYISPLSAVFIVAHEIARIAWRLNPAPFDVREYLDAAQKKYTSTQFRKILAAIEQLYPTAS